MPTIPQDAKSRDVYAHVTLSFRLRPAGWAGNDRHVVYPVVRWVLAAVRLLAQYQLRGDEELQHVTVTWSRDDDAPTTLSQDELRDQHIDLP